MANHHQLERLARERLDQISLELRDMIAMRVLDDRAMPALRTAFFSVNKVSELLDNPPKLIELNDPQPTWNPKESA